MGVHTIQVKQFNKNTYQILTHEFNKHVPVWNHRIVLEKLTEESCKYTDEVEIYAGVKTPFVVAWSKIFYKHRQRKWVKLLRMIGEEKDTAN